MGKDTNDLDTRAEDKARTERKEAVNCVECGASVFCDDLILYPLWEQTGLCLECSQRHDEEMSADQWKDKVIKQLDVIVAEIMDLIAIMKGEK